MMRDEKDSGDPLGRRAPGGMHDDVKGQQEEQGEIYPLGTVTHRNGSDSMRTLLGDES
jgi:hypothetical protein